jgi:hypothetical protein
MSFTITRRAVPALLVVAAVVVTACGAVSGLGGISGPSDLGDLRVSVDNRSTLPVLVRATTVGEGLRGGGDTTIDPKAGGELISRLGETWEVAIRGRHVLGSGERPELALVAGAPRRDLLIEVIVAPDGTVALKSARFVEAVRPAEG